jgi:CRP-like cAMP-binding protein
MNPDKLFTERTKVLNVPAGQTLSREGEPGGDVMFVLVRGTADILVGEAVIDSAGPEAFLGELALIDASPRAATVVATTDCRFVPMNREQFHESIWGTPFFATEVMRVMADRLRRMVRRVAGGPGSAPDR